MSSEQKPQPDKSAAPTPPPSATVRTDVSKADKIAWNEAKKKTNKSLEQWAIDELNSAAREENGTGETKK